MIAGICKQRGEVAGGGHVIGRGLLNIKVEDQVQVEPTEMRGRINGQIQYLVNVFDNIWGSFLSSMKQLRSLQEYYLKLRTFHPFYRYYIEILEIWKQGNRGWLPPNARKWIIVNLSVFSKAVLEYP